MGRFGAVPGFGCCSSFALKRSGRRFGGRAAPRGSYGQEDGNEAWGQGPPETPLFEKCGGNEESGEEPLAGLPGALCNLPGCSASDGLGSRYASGSRLVLGVGTTTHGPFTDLVAGIRCWAVPRWGSRL